MADTDATKCLYFTRQLQMAVEAFECFLAENAFPLGDVLLPIVHTEADFSSPIRLWDEITLQLSCAKMGTSSFAIETKVEGHGRVQIVHVTTDSQGRKIPITPALKTLLLQLEPLEAACQQIEAE